MRDLLNKWIMLFHFGRLFGFVGQILFALTMLGVMWITWWGFKMWWQRRPRGSAWRFGKVPVRGAWRKAPKVSLVGWSVLTLVTFWVFPVLAVSAIGFVVFDVALGRIRAARQEAPTPGTAEGQLRPGVLGEQHPVTDLDLDHLLVVTDGDGLPLLPLLLRSVGDQRASRVKRHGVQRGERPSSRSIRDLSNPTAGRPSISTTGTPICPLRRTRSSAAAASLLTSISRNGTRRWTRYVFTRVHHEHVGVVKTSTRCGRCVPDDGDDMADSLPLDPDHNIPPWVNSVPGEEHPGEYLSSTPPTTPDGIRQPHRPRSLKCTYIRSYALR
jgi:hypothetical protein